MKGPRFKSLSAKDWLGALGLSDTKAGWEAYVEELVELNASKEKQKLQGFSTLSKGWAIGTPGWRKRLILRSVRAGSRPFVPASARQQTICIQN